MRHSSLALAALLLIAGCEDDGDGGPGPGDLAGAQIDQNARPAISTALIGTFNPNTPAKNTVKDRYNAAAPSAEFIGEIAANLAVYDALDGVCGNQLLAGSTVDAQRYRPLATVLADDRLFVNTASGSCTTYLAVEANATGFAANDDCGGRTPLYDVIDITYSVLALGQLTGVTDNVDTDDADHDMASVPFLADPLVGEP